MASTMLHEKYCNTVLQIGAPLPTPWCCSNTADSTGGVESSDHAQEVVRVGIIAAGCVGVRWPHPTV